MGKGTITFILLAYFSFPLSAQVIDSTLYHSNSYRLEIPEDWLKPKTIKPITEILPATFDELKERQFCTSGKAGYTIRLLIDSIDVYDELSSNPQEMGNGPDTYFRYTFSFKYRFYAALLLFDSLQKPISQLRLVSREELLNFSKDYTHKPDNGVYIYEDLYNRAGTKIIGKKLVEKQKPYITQLPSHNAVSILNYEFMLGICRQKIYEIRKLLKSLATN